MFGKCGNWESLPAYMQVHTYMAFSVLKGIIEWFPVLAAATLHTRLPRRLKGFAKAFFVNFTSCNGIEVKLNELTPWLT